MSPWVLLAVAVMYLAVGIMYAASGSYGVAIVWGIGMIAWACAAALQRGMSR